MLSLGFRPGSSEIIAQLSIYETQETAGYAKFDEKKRPSNQSETQRTAWDRNHEHEFDEFLKHRKHWKVFVLWNVASGVKLHTFSVPDRELAAPIVSSDGRFLGTTAGGSTDDGSAEPTLVLWDLQSHKELGKRQLAKTDQLLGSTGTEREPQLCIATNDGRSLKWIDIPDLKDTGHMRGTKRHAESNGRLHRHKRTFRLCYEQYGFWTLEPRRPAGGLDVAA